MNMSTLASQDLCRSFGHKSLCNVQDLESEPPNALIRSELKTGVGQGRMLAMPTHTCNPEAHAQAHQMCRVANSTVFVKSL